MGWDKNHGQGSKTHINIKKTVLCGLTRQLRWMLLKRGAERAKAVSTFAAAALSAALLLAQKNQHEKLEMKK